MKMAQIITKKSNRVVRSPFRECRERIPDLLGNAEIVGRQVLADKPAVMPSRPLKPGADEKKYTQGAGYSGDGQGGGGAGQDRRADQ